MTNKVEIKNRDFKSAAHPQSGGESLEMLDHETGLIEGKVSELAGDIQGDFNPQSDDDTTQVSQVNFSEVDIAENNRIALRNKLLSTAPDEDVMRNEVKDALNREKNQLSKDYSRCKRKDDYKMLGDILMRIREIFRELEQITQFSIERIIELWLRLIHNFA